jgi:hypothetical protein
MFHTYLIGHATMRFFDTTGVRGVRSGYRGKAIDGTA